MDKLLPSLSNQEQISRLRQRIGVLEDYLQLKVDERDWHGVQDAASDLRDIESELKGLNFNG